MKFWRSKNGPHGREEDIHPAVRVALTVAQKENRDAVFHGACLDCLHRKGNASGTGMQWCMGCAFSTFSDHLPNRHLRMADEEMIHNVEQGYYDYYY